QFVNERTLELTGRTERELIGRQASDMLPVAESSGASKRLLAQGHSDRYEVRVTNGELTGAWLEITGGPLANADGVIAVTREIVDQLEGQPRATGVVLRAEVPMAAVAVETDARLLRQVLINLAGNALRFTHQGHVVISLVVDPATQRPNRIDVSDTGIGIPA